MDELSISHDVIDQLQDALSKMIDLADKHMHQPHSEYHIVESAKNVLENSKQP